MSSSRLMDAGRAITPGQPRIPTSLALALVGLVGMIFICSALYWVGAQFSGWATGSDTAQTEPTGEDIDRPGPRDRFPVISSQDRTDCLARAYWYIAEIQTPTGIVRECHPQ